MTPEPPASAEILAAFRKVTGWTDGQVLHYASCGLCDAYGEALYLCGNAP